MSRSRWEKQDSSTNRKNRENRTNRSRIEKAKCNPNPRSEKGWRGGGSYLGLTSSPSPSPTASLDAVWQRKDEPPAVNITPPRVPLLRTRSSGHRRPVRSTAACSAKGEHAHRRGDRRRRHHFPPAAMGGHRSMLASVRRKSKRKKGRPRKQRGKGTAAMHRRRCSSPSPASRRSRRDGPGHPAATVSV